MTGTEISLSYAAFAAVHGAARVLASIDDVAPIADDQSIGTDALQAMAAFCAALLAGEGDEADAVIEDLLR